MTLSKLRHEIRNHLNAIKLCCALIHRQTGDAAAKSTTDEVDRSADRIADLVIRYMNDEAAPKLLRPPPGGGRYDQ
jgi:nitrogen-specific signal transduction histidine kinase